MTTPEQYQFKLTQNQFKKASFKLTKTQYTNYKKRLIEYTYVRYADDWIILINSTDTYAQELKNIISNWLNINLSLTLSESKTKITTINRKPYTPANFLGFSITIQSSQKLSSRPIDKLPNTKIYERTTGHTINITPDYQRLFTRLQRDGFCDKEYYPICKNPWTTLPDFEIIGRYNQKILGLYNYFQPMCNNKTKLHRIHYILYYSCLFTLARKKATRISKLFKDNQVKINFDARYQTFFPFVTIDPKDKKELKRLENLQKKNEIM